MKTKTRTTATTGKRKTRTTRKLLRCVYLDRDGVVTALLNINTPDQTVLIKGVREAIAKLRAAGFLVILITNQGGIGENLDGTVRWKNRPLTREMLALIHAFLQELLGDEARLDDIKFCPHSKAVQCKCRKPEPELILEAAREHGIDLAGSYMIGDRATDIEAGNNAGVTPILVLTGPDGAQTAEKDLVPPGTLILPSLVEAAEYILSQPARKPARRKTPKKAKSAAKPVLSVTDTLSAVRQAVGSVKETESKPLQAAVKKADGTMTTAELVAHVARLEGAKSVVVMVGIPASGKSTFCDPLEKLGYVRLNQDAIRKELFGDESIIGDAKGAKQVRELFRQRLEEQLAAGKRVLVDNTNFNQRNRKPTLDRISAAGYTDVQLLILDVPLEECLRRNAARSRVVPEDFMRLAYGELHASGWPTSAEGKRIVVKPGTTRDEFVVSFPE